MVTLKRLCRAIAKASVLSMFVVLQNLCIRHFNTTVSIEPSEFDNSFKDKSSDLSTLLRCYNWLICDGMHGCGIFPCFFFFCMEYRISSRAFISHSTSTVASFVESLRNNVIKILFITLTALNLSVSLVQMVPCSR